MNGRQTIGVGLLLVLVGVAVPLLMVLGVVQSGFALAFASYACSVAGLFLALIGAARLRGAR